MDKINRLLLLYVRSSHSVFQCLFLHFSLNVCLYVCVWQVAHLFVQLLSLLFGVQLILMGGADRCLPAGLNTALPVSPSRLHSLNPPPPSPPTEPIHTSHCSPHHRHTLTRTQATYTWLSFLALPKTKLEKVVIIYSFISFHLN